MWVARTRAYPGVYVLYSLLSLTGTLQWRHNGRDRVSNHQPHDCLLNRLFRRRLKKTSKLRATGLCAGNSPGTGEFPAQRANNAENVSIWWRHDDLTHLQNDVIAVIRPNEMQLWIVYIQCNLTCKRNDIHNDELTKPNLSIVLEVELNEPVTKLSGLEQQHDRMIKSVSYTATRPLITRKTAGLSKNDNNLSVITSYLS